MDNNLVQKSVRLPTDLVAWVNEQEGRDFSKKLVGILMEYRSGEEDRLQMIQRQKAAIEDYGKAMSNYRELFYESSNMYRRLADLLPDAQDLEELLSEG